GAALAYGSFVASAGGPSLAIGAPGENAALFRAGGTVRGNGGVNGLGAALATLPLGGDGDALVVGAPSGQEASPGVGSVYAVRPGQAMLNQTLQLDGSGTPAALSINGAHPGDAFGSALAVTDLDGDGFSDLLVAGKQFLYVYKGPLP